ncbi:Fc.00g107720.m01.CDS01 [Cosmosporella sp. VM-42]
MKLNEGVVVAAHFTALVIGQWYGRPGVLPPDLTTEMLQGEVPIPDDPPNAEFDSVLEKKAHVPKGKKKFTLTQVRNSEYQPLDGQSAILQAYAKYGTMLPPGMQEATTMDPALDHKSRFFFSKSAKTGSVPAYPQPHSESEYVVPVRIGTPPQTIYLNLDTGSADLWTFSTDTYPDSAEGHVLYHPKVSKTCKRVDGLSWNVRYGDGAGASGIVYKDRVQIGATSFNTQSIQSAIQVSPDIASDKFSSGILGIAFSVVNTVRPSKQKTYIENIQTKLALPIFTANLQKGKPGSYSFGSVDPTQYTGHISYTAVDQNTPFWKFRASGFQVGKNPFQTYTWPAIVDTGTSLLLAPKHIVDAYYSKVTGATFDKYRGMMTIPCDATLPDFTFGARLYRGVVPGHYLNYGRASSTRCYGGIQIADGLPFAVLGDVVLKAQYVVFDMRSRTLGFANKKTVTKG